jgi:hypothetical protein
LREVNVNSVAAAGATSDDLEELERIKQMPREVGVLLIVMGIGGLLLPGPVGSPFVILGGVMLWPRAFARVEAAFARHFPRTHRQSVRQIRRFVDDLERRYPLTTREHQP